MSENPLKNFGRTEKLFIQLPTGGYWYQDSDIDLSNNKEIGILPMTAVDELALNTPDALLNGEGLVKVIKSCCPLIKNPRVLLSNDVDALMLAIQYASSGPTMEVEGVCPNCNEKNVYDVEIRPLIEMTKFLEPPYLIELDKNIKVSVKPISFSTSAKMVLQKYKMDKLISKIEVDKDETDDILAVVEKYNSEFMKIAELSVQIVLDGIDTVTVNNNGNISEIRNEGEGKQFITEWCNDLNSKTVNIIRDKVQEISEIGIPKEFNVTCDKCEYNWDMMLSYNPVNFS